MNFLPCSMAHRWQEDFRTAADKGYEGCDANMAVHPEYVDHPLNLSNWHTYGKLCWNPYLDPDDILCEWLTMEYGADAVVFLPGLRETYPATIGALFSRSAFTQCHSYVARYNYLDTRLNGPWRVWTDLLHPGMDRVGENVLGLELPLDAYPEAQRLALRNDPRYQLIFNRMPLTDAYAAELMAEKRVATGHMEGVLSAWQQLEGKIDPASFAQVAGLLEANVNDVRIFVDCFGLYLDYKLGRLEAAQIEAMRARYADVPKGEATVGSHTTAGSGITLAGRAPIWSSWTIWRSCCGARRPARSLPAERRRDSRNEVSKRYSAAGLPTGPPFTGSDSSNRCASMTQLAVSLTGNERLSQHQDSFTA